jgi:hypothetical protein
VRWGHAVAQVFQVVALEVGKQQEGIRRAHVEFGARGQAHHCQDSLEERKRGY